ncbi:MAG: LysM peptidoglycan-binding domain-containing protein [Gammaproteobacteria bacterium]|nr:LysM peptidoglycan-binding domain-containing protein [Gammaproteobacteria bacterium]
MKQVFLFVIAFVTATANVAAEQQNSFPRPPELEPDIRFWIRVYTEVDTGGGLIHDARHLNVVYEVVRFRDNASRRAREQVIKEAKRRYRHILRKLARGESEDLSAEEQRVLALWPTDVDKRTLRSAAHRLRFQLGQSDKFRAGLIRSGVWANHIENTLAEFDLPAEIIALPHVESSYNPAAYSHVGAAGLWQFTRSTGRRYLRINSAVDERMDPFKATVAAARLLEHNRAVTGSWPLAMTAYNHGAAGMRRAARRLGTSDIVTVVRRHRSRTFGFASRNFYVAFLAAIDVHYNAEKYFGTLERDQPVKSETVKVPAYVTVATLSRILGIDHATLRAHNLALRPAVWNGNKYVPRGYELRIPSNQTPDSAEAALAAITPNDQYQAQMRDRFYKVRSGNTLAGIAARFGVSVDDLMAANNLRNRHRIRRGQVLRLPGPDTKSKITLASARPPSGVALSTPADGLYRVQSGDTLSLIAGRFAIDEQQLVRLNQLSNKHRIYPGQVLRLTESAVASVEPAATVSEAITEVTTEAITEVTTEAITEVATEVETGAGSQIMSESTEVTMAEETGAFLVAQAQVTLAADPSDYAVSDGQTIEVQAAETLGHYAEWLGIRASRLRVINDMHYREPVVIGQQLRLDFSRVHIETFEQRRLGYHRALQDEFFAQFRIAGTQAHTVQRGDSLWILSKRTYNLPIWLLRQYNPDLDFSTVVPGTNVTIPLVQDRPEPAPPPRVDPVLGYTG